MKDEAIGAILRIGTTNLSSRIAPAVLGWSQKAHKWPQASTWAHRGDSTCVLVVADESTPMTEDAWNRIVDELMKPRFAFERTYEGHRYTRKI